METDAPRDLPERSPMTPGWKALTLLAVFYLGCLVVATWPAFATFGSTIPSRVDPLAHLWTMRWNKACLVEGRLPFFCPEIQYPVGASLGTLPPMHFQTLLYVPLSFVFANDALCYNLIRTFSFLLTGLGTFILIWNVVRSRLAAALGGLMAMISSPMLCFSHTELEQITVGWFPVFLVAWTRFVDRPSGRGLLAASGFYALVAMSAPYFSVFAVFPACLYVAWRGIGAGWSGIVPWMRARAWWLTAFGGLTGSVLLFLFANQIWSLGHGHPMSRPDAEFAMYRTPFWTYLVPPPMNLLSRLLHIQQSYQLPEGAIPSYLGVASLALIAYAAIARVKFAQGGYWWAVLALLMVLSFGAHAWIGGYDVSLPAAWLKKYFIGFRMIRVPARFNLFAAVAASLVAAAGLKHLLAKLPSRSSRIAVFTALAGLVLADLSTIPYNTIDLPSVPPCYAVIRKGDPGASFVDVPQFNSGAFQLPALCTYWQSFHGGKTSAGYTAFLNARYDNLLFYNSPFDPFKLAQPNYLANPENETFELAHDLDFRSYAWLYLKVHDLRYVVVHQRPEAFPEFAIHLDRLKNLLHDAKVFEDDRTAVYDRDLLPAPTRAAMLYTEGWGERSWKHNRRVCMVGPSAKIQVYNPSQDLPLRFDLDASANKNPRRVVLRDGSRELARWTISPDEVARLESPPFRLKAGLSELTLESDGEEHAYRSDPSAQGATGKFSLWTSRVGLTPASKLAGVAEQPRDAVKR